MPITNGYTTLATLKGEMKFAGGDTTDDTRLERAIEAASRLIDQHCGWPARHFYKSTSATRHFDADVVSKVWIDDVATVSEVALDPGFDGTFEDVLTSAQYLLTPHNAAVKGRPFTAVETVQGRKRFPVGVKGVKITGEWGWPAVPDVVEEACLIQSQRFVRRAQAPFGIAQVATIDGGAGMRLNAKLDPDVCLLLHDLVRDPIGVS